jgi:twitching motility protein PilT
MPGRRDAETGGVAGAPPSLEPLLRRAVERRASDVHLKVPSPPLLRVDGVLAREDDLGPVTPAIAEAHLATMLAGLPHSAKQLEFEARGEVDFSFGLAGLGRFRVNAYRQRGSVSLVLRPVPVRVPSLAELGLPDEAGALADAPEGLVVVCGPAGSGVTSTIAALVDRVNDGPPRSVMTVEDPIEVLHADRGCAISQREVGIDTDSTAEALARVLRQDPDVLVIGALDDGAAAEAALAAAASGVLVIAGMRAGDAAEAAGRLVTLHPPHRQQEARVAVAGALRAVVAQRLVPREGGGRRAEVAVTPGTGYAGPAPLVVASGRPAAIAVGSPVATSR